ncbi:S-adenosyl-L-methionine-dependent methyltransferase [Xylariaceae sp. FL0255]|nr:S-adenosyl-L-methionine-dependent methyltransferase [Xylariaceae sp. FL0255]
MPSHAPTESSNSSSYGGYSTSTRPVSESAVPELDPDLSTTDDVTSDYFSTRTGSILSPTMDHEGFDPSHFDATSIYAPSHFPTVSIRYASRDRSWEDEETMDSTRSITDQDMDYAMENGRRYCGPYYMPNDEDEQVRLQLLNQVYLKIMDGELTTVLLEGPSHILDVGTGVGEWAIDMAEAYPDCDVTGTDISNIFERRVPQNVYWEVDDAEMEWERPSNYYDLIHFRDMMGAFSNWSDVYKSAFKCLKPGGWIEVLDFDDRNGFADLFSYIETDSLLHKLAHDLQEASVLSGRPRGVEHLEPRLLVNAGYVDVKLTEYSIPLKTQDGSTGKFWLLACLNGMEPICMRLLTKYKGWHPDDVRMGCEMVGEELMTLVHDPKRAKSFVVKLRVLTGRKPGHWPVALPSIMNGTRGIIPADMSENVLQVDEDVSTLEGGREDDSNDLASTRQIEDEGETGLRPRTIHGHVSSETFPSSTGHTTEDWVRNVVHPSHIIDKSDGDGDTNMDETMTLEQEKRSSVDEDDDKIQTSTGEQGYVRETVPLPLQPAQVEQNLHGDEDSQADGRERTCLR